MILMKIMMMAAMRLLITHVVIVTTMVTMVSNGLEGETNRLVG